MDFWGTLPDWVSAVGNIIVAVAAAVAAWQGVRSLTAWREETRGRRRMELAEEVLADIYEARAIFRWIRSPASYSSESEGRPGRAEDPEAIRQHRDTFYVPLKRLSDHAEFFARANARRYRVIAAFGVGAERAYELMHEINVTISVSAQALMMLNPNSQQDRLVRREEKMEADVWEGSDPQNPVTQKISEMVAVAEERFRREIV